jgi:hypothetical protein
MILYDTDIKSADINYQSIALWEALPIKQYFGHSLEQASFD